MLVTIGLQRLPTRQFRAMAPDFPGCELTDSNADSAVARLRLLVEGALTDAFLAGYPPPALRPPGDWKRATAQADTQWTQIHINVPHIQAVARHQRRP